jgi:hypothetical protein
MILGRAEASAHTEEEQLIVQKIKAILDEDLNINGGASLNLEAYAHTNTDFGSESDWIIGYEQRKPLLEAFVEFSFLDTVYSYCDIRIAKGKFSMDDTRLAVFQGSGVWPEWGIGTLITELPQESDELKIRVIEDSVFYSSAFSSNILTKASDFDSAFPKRALFSAGGTGWFASIGRDRLDWGNSSIGNLVIDDHVDFHDHLRLEFFSDKFKYEFLTLFLESDLSCRQTEDESTRFFISHRLEYRPFGSLTLSISEGVMYRTDGIIELKYFNPSFILHNLDNHSIFNAIAHLEADWQVAKGLNLYTQFALDQATAPGEGRDQSPSFGLVLGAEYTSASPSGIFSTSLEGVYTSPLVYRRDEVDFLVISRNKVSGTGGYVVDIDFLGFPYGNDSIVFQSESRFDFFSGASIGFTAREIVKGTLDIYASHNSGNDNTALPNLGGTTPYGDTAYFATILDLNGSYEFSSHISAEAQMSFINRWDTSSRSSSNDFQIAVSLSYSI